MSKIFVEIVSRTVENSLEIREIKDHKNSVLGKVMCNLVVTFAGFVSPTPCCWLSVVTECSECFPSRVVLILHYDILKRQQTLHRCKLSILSLYRSGEVRAVIQGDVGQNIVLDNRHAKICTAGVSMFVFAL